MTADFAYRPCNGQSMRRPPPGETAVLFAEKFARSCASLWLPRSAWAPGMMDDSLNLAWAAAKPIYESDEPERALMRSVAAVRPASSGIVGAHCICLRGTDRKRCRLGARCDCRLRSLERPEPDGTGRLDRAVRDGCDHSAVRRCGGIPPKLAAAAAARGDRSGYLGHDPAVNAFGSSGVNAGVAMLWRHLAHWPALLARIHGAFAPPAITRTDRRGDSGSNHRPIWRSAAASFRDVRHTTRANVQMPAED